MDVVRTLVMVGLAGCSFSLEPGASAPLDALAIDASLIDAAICTTDPGGPCPANYVFVPQNCAYDAGEFCIAKYEMKDVSGVATSRAAGLPRGTITTADAKAACSALGPRYHLVTNDEWMATARAIEANPLNWSTTSTPFLSKGKTDECFGPCPGLAACPPHPTAASTDNDPCSTTIGPQCADRSSADFRFNRTAKLGSDVIWDFAGHMFELLDHPRTSNITEGARPGVDINTATGSMFAPPLAEVDYKSANLAHGDFVAIPRPLPDPPVQNIGILFVTAVTSTNFTRGGDWCSFAGIYSVSLLADSELGVNVGFRCAYK